MPYWIRWNRDRLKKMMKKVTVKLPSSPVDPVVSDFAERSGTPWGPVSYASWSLPLSSSYWLSTVSSKRSERSRWEQDGDKDPTLESAYRYFVSGAD